jgi:hypothetical protein
MIDAEGLVRFAFASAAIAGLVFILRWLGNAEGGSLADLFRIPVDPPLPRGAQEEEPQRWQLERLSRPRTGDVRGSGATTSRQAVDCSPRTCLPLTD